ncbi:hypothetical protein GC194_10745 [bacterium]|nr:hypothetical protein [bacterium]
MSEGLVFQYSCPDSIKILKPEDGLWVFGLLHDDSLVHEVWFIYMEPSTEWPLDTTSVGYSENIIVSGSPTKLMKKYILDGNTSTCYELKMVISNFNVLSECCADTEQLFEIYRHFLTTVEITKP